MSCRAASAPASRSSCSLLETVILLYYAALAASLIVKVGLVLVLRHGRGRSPATTPSLHWAAPRAQPSGIFWIGTAVLVLAGLLLATGTRRYFTVQKVLFVMARGRHRLCWSRSCCFGSRATFEAQPHRADRARVRRRDQDRQAERLRRPSGFDLGARRSSSWSGRCCRCSARCSRSASAARSRRSAAPSCSGCWARSSPPAADRPVRGAREQGVRLRRSRARSASTRSPGSPTAPPSPRSAPRPSSRAGRDPRRTTCCWPSVIMATFVAWIWFWVPAEIAYTTRTMIAWSFDRLAPTGSATSASGSTPRWWRSACRPPGRSCSCG